MIRPTAWLLIVALASGCAAPDVEEEPASITVIAPARVIAGETVELRAILHAGDAGLAWTTLDSRRGIELSLYDGPTRWYLGVAGENGYIRYGLASYHAFSLGPHEEMVVHMAWNGTTPDGRTVPPGSYQLVAALNSDNQTLSSSQPLVLEPAASVASAADGSADGTVGPRAPRPASPGVAVARLA